jgi:hypothetical protein
LQCSHAENSGCDFFITSDRKLKGRHTLYGMRICTPEEFVNLLENLPSKPDSLPFLVPQKGR